MNPQPRKPTVTNPTTAIAQQGGDHLGVRPTCEPDRLGLSRPVKLMLRPSLSIQAFLQPPWHV
jgi:hypothetical protein